MGQLLSTIDKCFQPEHLKDQSESTTFPKPQNKSTAPPSSSASSVSKPVSTQPKAGEKPVEKPAAVESPLATPAAAAATAVAESGDLPPYTNRPEDLTPYPKAQGKYVPKNWEHGVTPSLKLPKLTGEFVTDGKVSFDKAVLSMEGVFPTRDEELAQLQKAIDMKKDAGAETAAANALHEEHNKLFSAGDKDGARDKLAESKIHREKAKAIHEESFDLAYKGAMSMGLKALYSKYPSVDYHVFLQDPYQQSFLVIIDMMNKYGQFGCKDFLVIPGEGQHSSGAALIRPHFEKWMADNNIGNEKITAGSFAIILKDVAPL